MLFFPKRERSEIRGIYNLYFKTFSEKLVLCSTEALFKVAKKEDLTFLGVEIIDFKLSLIEEGVPTNILLVGSNYISSLLRQEPVL